MEIGNQIKQLRMRRGITQEAMAQHLGVTAQAVSKWERGAATPDIGLLPEISAYFGVTIDELFSLSDDTRMDRIQNMIWDVRYLDPADVEKEQRFLIEKAKREPENHKVFELLSDMENHLAKEHHDRAADFAKDALKRDPGSKSAHASLIEAMGGIIGDWYVSNHFMLIDYYRTFVHENPTVSRGYMWLMDHLLDAGRIEEAEQYYREFQKIDNTFRSYWYAGSICWYRGDKESAFSCWKQMELKFPDDWMVYLSIGDMLAKTGAYENAKAYYRTAISKQTAPVFCDCFESIAQVCELQGNIQEAIDVLTEELEIMRTDWGETSGETSDYVRRNIARLKKQM